MCRACGVNHQGRRCPGDNADARRMRRHNATLRERFSGAVLSEPKLSPAVKAENRIVPVDIRQLRAAVKKLQELSDSIWDGKRGDRSDGFQELEQRSTLVGGLIARRAIEAYGAPTDAELKNAEAEDAHEKEARAKQIQAEMNAALDGVDDVEEELQGTGVNRETYPVLSERWKAWSEKFPELWAERQKYNELAKRKRMELDSTLNGVDVETELKQEQGACSPAEWNRAYARQLQQTKVSQLLRKRADAYRSALQDAGVFLSDGEVKVNPKSDPQAVAALREALQNYPQSWLAASNAQEKGRTLLVKSTKKRAHYQHRSTLLERRRVPEFHFEQKPNGNELTAAEVRDGMTPLPREHPDDFEILKWKDPSGVKYQLTVGPGYTAYVRAEYIQQREKPTRGHWVEVSVPDLRLNDETRQLELDPDHSHIEYRRPKTHLRTLGYEEVSDLLVSENYDSGRVSDNLGYSTAMHEFAHRAESVIPTIKALEETFIERRVAAAGREEDKNPSQIYKGTKEYGYWDTFPDHYMGKIYDDGSREVLSMGMEMVFSGRSGGGVGLGKYAADDDYRNFVLGALTL